MSLQRTRFCAIQDLLALDILIVSQSQEKVIHNWKQELCCCDRQREKGEKIWKMRGMPVCCAVNNMGCMCVGRLKGKDFPLPFSVVEIWMLNVLWVNARMRYSTCLSIVLWIIMQQLVMFKHLDWTRSIPWVLIYTITALRRHLIGVPITYSHQILAALIQNPTGPCTGDVSGN